MAFAAVVATPAQGAANGWPPALARADSVAIRAEPAESAPVMGWLGRYEAIQLVEAGEEWSEVLGQRRGWVRSDEIVVSQGVIRFWDRQYAAALDPLETEIGAEPDRVIRDWLRFYLSYTLWALDRPAEALSAFGEVVGSASTELSAFALIARAKLHAEAGDKPSVVREYRHLLGRHQDIETMRPDRVPRWIDPYPTLLSGRLRGSPRIEDRIRVWEELIAAEREVARLDGQPRGSAGSRASARLRLARALDERTAVDPISQQGEGHRRGLAPVREAYERVVEVAGSGEAGGHAAFRLIQLSAPYEWEGDVQAQAEWTLERYGAFIESHPGHELVAEALFEAALATWAGGGYPEVYGLVVVPSREVRQDAEARLARWFPFRGTLVDPAGPPAPDPARAREAALLLKRVTDGYPDSPAAPMARYYIGVIFDYAFGMGGAALSHYQAFIKAGGAAEFEERARARISEIEAARRP